MKVVRRQVKATPEQVWSALSDGWNYASWVVGASHIRDVGQHWPRQGSVIHHSVGVWPLLIHDRTTVVESEPGHRLVLQARAGLTGQARIELTVEPSGNGTLVTMAEWPTDGPARRLLRPVIAVLLPPRNAESLLRLARLAEGRYGDRGRDTGNGAPGS